MNLYVKYMISQRCKMRVQDKLKKLGILFWTVDLGVIELLKDITPEKRGQLKANLQRSGLELLDDKRSIQQCSPFIQSV